MVAFGLNGNEVLVEFLEWLLYPLNNTGMTMLLFLEPRRTDLLYKACLYIQYELFTLH